jgi:hypothetical protein
MGDWLLPDWLLYCYLAISVALTLVPFTLWSMRKPQASTDRTTDVR